MPLADSKQPEWTTSRCFRLLRPIVSRKTDTQITQGTTRRNVRGSTTVRSRFGGSPNAQQDPDWMAKPRKLASRQYSKTSTSSSDPVVDVRVGALSIPTPEIQRFHGLLVNAPNAHSSAEQDRFNNRGRCWRPSPTKRG